MFIDPFPTHSPPGTLDAHEAAKYLRVTRGTLANWRCTAKGPVFYKIGRKILYKNTDLEAFLTACAVDPVVPHRPRPRPTSSNQKIELDGGALPFTSSAPARRRGRPARVQPRIQ